MSGITLTADASELAKLDAMVEKTAGAVTREDVRLQVGRAVAETIRTHFSQLANDQAHHQIARSLGAAPTGFYERAAGAVQSPQLEGTDQISISIDHQGLAQRLFGGTISAKPGSWLTIPARAEYYGERARDQADLQFIVFPSGLAALIQEDEEKHEGLVAYWLVKSVHQDKDPTVLPSEDKMLDPALAEVSRQLEAIWSES